MRIIGLIILMILFASPSFAQKVRKIDDFGLISCKETKERVEKITEEYRHFPDHRLYVIVYGGQYYPQISSSKKLKISLARNGEAEARTKVLLDLLVTRDETFKPVIVNGGFRQSYQVEIWLVPPSVEPPKPKPSIKNEDVKFRKGKISKKELAKIGDCL